MEADTELRYLTERPSFPKVLLTSRSSDTLRRIILHHGQPWLDDARVTQALGALQRLGAHKLMEANQAATELLLKGVPVDGEPILHGGRDQTVRFIDFDHPERNDFLAINQFRVDRPGNQGSIIPDIVLFVNGIPLVVVECKSPAATNPMEEAITQLLRYSNQRGAEVDEGVERLFHYNQVLVATYGYQARSGTIGASYEHFLEWKDTAPVPAEAVRAELGVEQLTSQQLLVAGMLRPAHLLDLVRNFTLFQQTGGGTIKIVARYHQFRAVQQAVQRLTTGRTRTQQGESDQRGGIIWHTQGSGKRLTMVFLIRKMRTLPALRRFKVVAVTDRTDLERQLSETAALTGEPLDRPPTSRDLHEVLRQAGAGLVFAMIQKYQARDPDEDAPETPAALSPVLARVAEPRGLYESANGGEAPPAPVQLFPALNTSADILILVDEAHRSHANLLHANLLAALPNAARIGFTGTPILMGDRKRTHDIFGDFIDRYTIHQSEQGGATVPILYEGRTADAAVADERTLDRLFEDMFRDRTPHELEQIRRTYATSGNVLEDEQLIAAKAEEMLRHYVSAILPNGFKAQVVATSRRAAVRYQEALAAACARLVEQLERLDPALLALDETEVEQLPPVQQFLVRAHAYLPTIRRLEFAAVISGRGNDPADWSAWSDEHRREHHIDCFKKPLVHADPLRQDGLAFLCVKNMLLTGFDAWVEQVLYLDRPMKEHELLQAIARVNRTAPDKACGFVVDYIGVTQHLTDALAAYSAEDVQGALVSLRDELPVLDERHRRVLDIFHSRGITDIAANIDACIHLLSDVALRAEFIVKLKQFLASLDVVLPRPEAIPYLSDACLLGWLNRAAANVYRDGQLNLVGAGAKVRRLIDEYVVPLEVATTIEPISILDADFEQVVDALPSERTRALKMEHEARYHISVHMAEDPARYKKLSQRLEEILQRFQDNWTELVAALHALTAEIRAGRRADESGLEPATQAPFLGVLAEAVRDGEDVPKERLNELATAAVALVDMIRQEVRRVDFWRNPVAQAQLRRRLYRALLDRLDLPPERLTPVVDEIVALARALHARLAQ